MTRLRPGASRSRLADCGDRGADGRAVLELAGLEVVDGRRDHGIVGGERHLGERLGGEGDHADAVAGASGDEALEHLARHLEPVVRLQVLGEHRAREVDGEDDSMPSLSDSSARAPLRGRARATTHAASAVHRSAATSRGRARPARGPRASTAGAREGDGRTRPPTAHPPEQRQEREQGEHPRRAEVERPEAAHAARSVGASSPSRGRAAFACRARRRASSS
jgi:hypothetical protein